MTNRNFNEIYNEIISSGTNELKQLCADRNIALGIFVVLMIVACFVMTNFKESNTVIFFVVALLFISFVVYFVNNNTYMKKYKDLVIKKIIYLYNSELRFSPNQGVTNREYKESFFETGYDKFYSEDLIEGPMENGLNLKMSQVKVVEERIERDSNGHLRKEEVILFQGLYGMVNVGDRVLSQIDMTTDSFFNRYNKERIEVDSGEFEKQYDLLSTDKVRTMEIFTSDLIDEINKFKEDTGYIIQIRIHFDRLYFRIKCGEVFEAPLLKEATDYGTLYKYFRMIDSPINIISKVIENADETRK